MSKGKSPVSGSASGIGSHKGTKTQPGVAGNDQVRNPSQQDR